MRGIMLSVGHMNGGKWGTKEDQKKEDSGSCRVLNLTSTAVGRFPAEVRHLYAP